MDRMSDSGSDDWGSNPHRGTTQKKGGCTQRYTLLSTHLFIFITTFRFLQVEQILIEIIEHACYFSCCFVLLFKSDEFEGGTYAGFHSLEILEVKEEVPLPYFTFIRYMHIFKR